MPVVTVDRIKGICLLTSPDRVCNIEKALTMNELVSFGRNVGPWGARGPLFWFQHDFSPIIFVMIMSYVFKLFFVPPPPFLNETLVEKKGLWYLFPSLLVVIIFYFIFFHWCWWQWAKTKHLTPHFCSGMPSNTATTDRIISSIFTCNS